MILEIIVATVAAGLIYKAKTDSTFKSKVSADVSALEAKVGVNAADVKTLADTIVTKLKADASTVVADVKKVI